MDYRYLTETKNEFNNFLCGILVPHLYHGIRGMLKYSEDVYNQIELKNKTGAKITNPGVINIFKKTLDGISSLNNHVIEEEYLRIKNSSGCVDWFDNLVKAAFKSYVLFLTWDPKKSNSKFSDNNFYESIVIKDFIHKCYVMSCNYFRDNPEIFISKNNKKEIFEIIKMCIELSIKKSLPYNQIIQDYLQIEFDQINDPLTHAKELENIKNMVFNMMNEKKYGSRPNINNLIIDSANDEYVNLEDTEYKQAQLENFINQEKINEQHKLYKLIESEQKLDNKYNHKSPNTHTHTHTSKKSHKHSNASDKSYISYKLSKSYTDKKAIDIDNITSDNYQDNQNDEQLNINMSISSHHNPITFNLSDIPSNHINTEYNKDFEQEHSIHNDISNIKLEIEDKIENEIDNIENKIDKIEDEIDNIENKIEDKNNSEVEIVSSIPIIKKKSKNKFNDLEELLGLNVKEDKKDKSKSKSKKNIKITKENNTILSEKFDQVESFYDNMIKI